MRDDMSNIFYWIGVAVSAVALKSFFTVFGTESFDFPTSYLFCTIYTFLGGCLIVFWKEKCYIKQARRYQWISFFFPFVGVFIAILSAMIFRAVM